MACLLGKMSDVYVVICLYVYTVLTTKATLEKSFAALADFFDESQKFSLQILTDEAKNVKVFPTFGHG